MNLVVGGTCRKNIIGFRGDDERFILIKVTEIETYRRLYNRIFRIVDTILKDSKIHCTLSEVLGKT